MNQYTSPVRVKIKCQTEGCASVLTQDGWHNTKTFCKLCLGVHASERYRKHHISSHWTNSKIRKIIPQLEEEL